MSESEAGFFDAVLHITHNSLTGVLF